MSEVKITAKTKLTAADALDWIRHNGIHVGNLANAGDKEALILRATYEAVFRDQKNVDKQNELVNVVSAFIYREALVSEARDLATKYGHRADRLN